MKCYTSLSALLVFTLSTFCSNTRAEHIRQLKGSKKQHSSKTPKNTSLKVKKTKTKSSQTKLTKIKKSKLITVTNPPTTSPTKAPTTSPTKAPTTSPTKSPTTSPTKAPTTSPIVSGPTKAPTPSPTKAPTTSPTKAPTPSPTSSWTQIGADIDADAGGDEFGYMVSLSTDGTTLAAGAYKNDANGNNSGAVRIFTLAAGSWNQIGPNLNGDAVDDKFGGAVALSTDASTLVAGAINHDTGGSNSGHVRIFVLQGGIYTETTSIDGERADDRSSNAVAVSSDGSTVAIGAILNDDAGVNKGHVRVYVKGATGDYTQHGDDIDGEVSSVSDLSGRSVSLSSDGTILAIGAINNDNDVGNNAGHVRVFKKVAVTSVATAGWEQIGTDIDGENGKDQSGVSVSLSSDGSTLAIGAAQHNGGVGTGHVRVWTSAVTSNTWTLVGDAILGDAVGNLFGWCVSLSGDATRLAVGAPQSDGVNGSQSGHVRVYSLAAGSWSQLGPDIDGEAASDQFGYSVSLSSDGSTLAVGAIDNVGSTGASSGHVRVYSFA